MSQYQFIVFEGIDGSGKSTQSKLLQKWFDENQLKCHATFEPTDNFIGRQIRAILTHQIKGHPITVANLFAADRYDHLTNERYGILRLLQSQHVVCDRYLLSSYAYQSLDAPMDWIRTINQFNASLRWPDLTFYISIDVATALQRIQNNRAQTDIFETQEKLEKIAQNYDAAISGLSEAQRKNVFIIDGTKPVADIFEEVVAIVQSRLLL